MQITQEEFDDKFREGLDALLAALAEHEQIAPEKFFSMACMLENLAFFSPVLYGLIRNSKEV